MKRIVLFTFAVLLLSLIHLSIAYGQEMPAKVLDPGWFMDQEDDIFQKKADDAYNTGRFGEAIVAYLEVLRYDKGNSGATYQLACCYGLTGQDTLAALFLTRAWDRGYVFLAHIKADTDFNKVRQSPVFKNTVDSLERSITALDSLEGARVYVPAAALSYYRVKLPKGYNPKKRYPLLLTLHGYSSNLDNHFADVIKQMPEPDFIFTSLQAPYWLPNSRESFRWRIPEYGPERQEQSVKMSEEYVANVIRTLKAQYNPSHVYLMGHSQGGWMTFNTGLNFPKLFDGLIAFGGWVDTVRIAPSQIKAAKKLKVLIVHGRNDKAVPFSWAESSRDRLKAGGLDVTFFDFDGGHEMPDAGVKKVFEWIER
jgi:phospholipase/carboxylesterase